MLSKITAPLMKDIASLIKHVLFRLTAAVSTADAEIQKIEELRLLDK